MYYNLGTKQLLIASYVDSLYHNNTHNATHPTDCKKRCAVGSPLDVWRQIAKENINMTSEELCEMTCPKCDKKMSHGYIAGHWIRLRWVDKPNTKTIFAGNALRKKINWLTAPDLEAKM